MDKHPEWPMPKTKQRQLAQYGWHTLVINAKSAARNERNAGLRTSAENEKRAQELLAKWFERL